MIRSAVPLAALVVVALARALAFPAGAARPEWTITGELSRPRAYASALEIPTGEILVFGGGLDASDPEVASSTTELIDPFTGRSSVLSQRIPGRLHHTVSAAWGGRIVVAGGVEWSGRSFGSTDRVDVYLPYEQRWAPAAPLHGARSDHGAAVLAGGLVLVTGGNFNTLPLRSSEIYDPRLDRWREAAPLPSPRLRFSMTTLPDGRVLVAGGLSEIGTPLASSLLYDPAADRWTAGPDLAVPRVQHSIVVLGDGDVLFIGGQDAASGVAERYDHLRNAFVYAGSLVEPRLVEQAALLPDGRVLVTGGSLELPGRTEWVPVANAEVWDPATNAWSVFDAPALPRALGKLVPTSAGLYLVSGIGTGQEPHRSIERLVLR